MAYANQNIDVILYSRGYPQDVLVDLCEEAKTDILNSGSTFESVEYINYDENGNEINNENENIMPYGQIQTAHLSLFFVIGVNSDHSKNVTFNYRWKTLPVNRWQDPIGVSWDSNCFKLRTGSFHKVDKYTYTNGSNGTIYTGTKSDEWAYANGGNYGCTWYADLKGHSSAMPVWSLYGYANFTLDRKTSGGSSQLFANYVHKKLAGSLSMSIPGFGSFSVSGSSYDELAAQTDIGI